MSHSPNDQLLQLVPCWSVQETGTLLETTVFAVRERHCASPLNPRKSGAFVYLETPDWVNVVALTRDRQVVLIEQFRHGLAEVTLELPGGTVESGESPAAAAVRELAEETGYLGATAEIIGMVTPNPAIQNNHCYSALIRDVSQQQAQMLDGNEEIAVRLVSLAEIPELTRRGVIHHALVVSAFHHLLLGGHAPEICSR